jgi:hypothetical protein
MEGNWMHASYINSSAKINSQNVPFPPVGRMSPFMQTWKKQIKDQEKLVANKHCSNIDPTRQASDDSEPHETSSSIGTVILDHHLQHRQVPEIQSSIEQHKSPSHGVIHYRMLNSNGC